MINVLVVDDSALMRKIISDKLNNQEDIKVVGIASNGKIAIDKIKVLNPDVVILDVEMPEMDGIETLKQIMSKQSLPIIMFSADSKGQSKKTLEAMRLGAVDFLLKPKNLRSNESSLKELIEKIRLASKAKIKKYHKVKTIKKRFSPTRKKIVVVASSTGGPQTLEAFLTQIPKNIPVPILIVQHMPPVFTKTLAERLNNICEIEVKEAKEGDELQNGTAFIAPGGYHMILKSEVIGYEGHIALTDEDPVLGLRPYANKLFKSVAPIFKENTIGIVLTGMGSDGTEGSKEIKKFKGTILAQSEDSCVIYGMPKSVVDANLADEIVPIDKMGVALLQLLDI